MKRRFMRSLPATALLTVLFSSCLLLSSPAHAALGGTVDSVSADTSALRGQLRSTPFVSYDLHQISGSLLVVNEYTTRDGQVFAITWHGSMPPDFRQLLGNYFGRVQTAAADAHRNNPTVHRFFSLEQSDLVVRVAAHLRSFGGIAYLPALLPQGVDVNQLQ